MHQIILNARLIDGTGNPPVDDYAILIEDEKISKIGSESEFINSKEYRNVDKEINAHGMTLVPGLINCHEHITWRRSYGSWTNRVVAKDEGWLLARGVGNCLISLKEGVTSVRDLGAKGNVAISLKNAVEDGIILGPRMMVCGQFIAMTGGHGCEAARIADGPDEVRKAAREQLLRGADLIKLMGSGGRISKVRDFPWSPQYSTEELRAGFEEAHKAGKKTTVHCHAPVAIRMAVEAGVDCIEHGGLLDIETAEFLAKKRIPLVPTLTASEAFIIMGAEYGRDTATIEEFKNGRPDKMKHWSQILQTGVTLVAGVDSLGDLVIELCLLVEIGMSPMQAILSATKTAAEVIGMADKVGTIEPGKFADFVLVKADPLKDINNLRSIEWVMKGGEMYTPEQLSKAVGRNLK
jgi:imidazolonepropionase-like amidohydrolase